MWLFPSAYRLTDFRNSKIPSGHGISVILGSVLDQCIRFHSADKTGISITEVFRLKKSRHGKRGFSISGPQWEPCEPTEYDMKA